MATKFPRASKPATPQAHVKILIDRGTKTHRPHLKRPFLRNLFFRGRSSTHFVKNSFCTLQHKRRVSGTGRGPHQEPSTQEREMSQHPRGQDRQDWGLQMLAS